MLIPSRKVIKGRMALLAVFKVLERLKLSNSQYTPKHGGWAPCSQESYEALGDLANKLGI